MTRLSPEEIKQQYKERTNRGLAPKQGHSTGSSTNSPLTPEARHVLRKAREHMAQNPTLRDGYVEVEALREVMQNVEEIEGESLSAGERDAALSALQNSRDHYDILTPLVKRANVTDIICASYNNVSVQLNNRENIKTNLSFPDSEAYKSFVEGLLKRSGKSCTTATPVVDVAVDPEVRACVTHESFSPRGQGPMLTLRISRHSSVNLSALESFGLAPKEILNYLSALVCSGRLTLLVSGEVAAGKTTLLRALAQEIPSHEAILVIEDTQEVVLPNRDFIRTLLTREANTEGVGRITPAQAVRTGMRMAMNRLILGEMRDSEAAEAFIDVCSSGHAGMSTIHARSGRDALQRLELFLARAQAGVSPEALKKQIANAVSLMVHLGLDPIHKKRRILEITEVSTATDGAIQLSPMYAYVSGRSVPTWKRAGGVSEHAALLKDARVTLSPKSSEIQHDELFH